MLCGGRWPLRDGRLRRLLCTRENKVAKMDWAFGGREREREGRKEGRKGDITELEREKINREGERGGGIGRGVVGGETRETG